MTTLNIHVNGLNLLEELSPQNSLERAIALQPLRHEDTLSPVVGDEQDDAATLVKDVLVRRQVLFLIILVGITLLLSVEVDDNPAKHDYQRDLV